MKLWRRIANQSDRFIKFGIVGLSGVLIRLAIFEFTFRVAFSFIQSSWRFSASNATAIVVSIFTNYLLNDAWTWGDRQKGGWQQWRNRLLKYYISAGIAGILDFFTAEVSLRFLIEPYFSDALLREWLATLLPFFETAAQIPELKSTLAVCIGIGVGMFINFIAGHFWAFRNDKSIMG